jgi:hypothetical protein
VKHPGNQLVISALELDTLPISHIHIIPIFRQQMAIASTKLLIHHKLHIQALFDELLEQGPLHS